MLPRDFIIQCIMGLGYELIGPDGVTWEAARLTNNPQWILDLVTTTPGSLLYRSDVGWFGLPPGAGGQVLTEVAGLPAWRDPAVAPAGAGHFITHALGNWGGFSGDARASDGMVIRATENLLVHRVYHSLQPATGVTYKAAIARVTGYPATPTIAAIQFVTVTVPTSIVRGKRFELQADFTGGYAMTAGSDYWLAICRTDGADNSAVGLAFQGGGTSRWPIPGQVLGQAQHNKITPAVGQAIDRWVADAYMDQGAEWSRP